MTEKKKEADQTPKDLSQSQRKAKLIKEITSYNKFNENLKIPNLPDLDQSKQQHQFELITQTQKIQNILNNQIYGLVL